MNPIVTKVTKAALQALRLYAVCASVVISPAATAQVFTKYCTTCHNERLKTAGLVIDPASLTHVGSNAETWEKVVRKLRANTMPPAGSPRPDEATYEQRCILSRNRTRPRRRGQAESRKAPAAPPPQPHGIQERDPGSFRAGCLAERDGFRSPSAGGQRQQRLR